MKKLCYDKGLIQRIGVEESFEWGKRMKRCPPRVENTEQILNIKEEQTRELQDTMGFGSTYAVRRLKYEKVDRVEQIANFRKYFRYYDAFLAKKTGWGKNQEDENYSNFIFSVIIVLSTNCEKIITPKYSCIPCRKF